MKTAENERVDIAGVGSRIESQAMGGAQIALNRSSTWRDYLMLCKPRVVGLIVFTAMVGMFLGSPGLVPLPMFFSATIGIGLAAAAGAAINHLVDQPADTVMNRTRNRPLPTGRVRPGSAGLFAAILCALSMLLLVVQIGCRSRIDMKRCP